MLSGFHVVILPGKWFILLAQQSLHPQKFVSEMLSRLPCEEDYFAAEPISEFQEGEPENWFRPLTLQKDERAAIVQGCLPV